MTGEPGLAGRRVTQAMQGLSAGLLGVSDAQEAGEEFYEE